MTGVTGEVEGSSPLYGYADRVTAEPGDRLTIMTSTAAPWVDVEVIRFLDGSPQPPIAPALSESVAGTSVRLPGGVQRSPVGSRADLPLPPGDLSRGQGAAWAWVYPTTPRDGRRQLVLGLGSADEPLPDLAVVIDGGCLALELHGAPAARSQERLHLRTWYGFLVTWEHDWVRLMLTNSLGRWFTREHDEELAVPIDRQIPAPTLLRLASWRVDGPSETLNGKVASPVVAAGIPLDWRALLRRSERPAGLVGQWDLLADAGSARIVAELDGMAEGWTTNVPTRALTGPFWSPQAISAGLTREHDAIGFHADDVGALDWTATGTLDLSSDLRSGVYAIRLRDGREEMHIPLVVREARHTADCAFLVPTNTYLAYANHRMFANADANPFLAFAANHPIEAGERDRLVLSDPVLGRSLYDLHDDGTGVSYASWRRPIVNMEPASRDFLNAGPRHFAADLYIVGWLERQPFPYACLTDEDLHRMGRAALDPYRVVVTGSHPEYWTRSMIEALQAYLLNGGRVMYLGGNGFYWVTSFTADLSSIEVRRGQVGSRAWTSAPGESVHATTAEPGGLWRSVGICPQSLVGVGMAAQGWGGGVGYRRLPDSEDPRVARFFDGIGRDEVIGRFGHSMCGAAGDEVDRIDHALGTPPHALHLATSERLPDEYQLAVEDVTNMTPELGGSTCDAVRSDLVWFDLPGGGEVFSVGSVNWAASLGWAAGQNNVDRLTSNVLVTMRERAGPRPDGGPR